MHRQILKNLIHSLFIQTSDGSLVIAGSVARLFSFPVPLPQMLMVKFDAFGTLLWSKSITTSDTRASYANSVAEDNDGGYIFSGSGFNYDSNFTQISSYGYIVKLNSVGTLQWTKTFTLSSFDWFNSIIHMSDGGYAVSGFTSLESNNSPVINGIIYKFDNNFEICGEAGSNGSVADEGTAVVKGIAVHNIAPVATDVNVTLASIGTAVNICNTAVITIYTFKGNGNWSEPTNWNSNTIPPSPLPQNSQIIIEPAGNGECILNVPVTIPQGDKITVHTGKKFKY